MVLEAPKVVNATLNLIVDDDQRGRVRRVGADFATSITGDISGNLLISLICGVLTHPPQRLGHPTRDCQIRPHHGRTELPPLTASPKPTVAERDRTTPTRPDARTVTRIRHMTSVEPVSSTSIAVSAGRCVDLYSYGVDAVQVLGAGAARTAQVRPTRPASHPRRHPLPQRAPVRCTRG